MKEKYPVIQISLKLRDYAIQFEAIGGSQACSHI